MNIQSFLEKLIFRDIIAIILPGGTVLLGFSSITHTLSNNCGWKKFFKEIFITNNVWIYIIFFVFFAFVLGHIIDLLYKLTIQKCELYKREDIIAGELKVAKIRAEVEKFIDIDSNKRRNHLLLRYWIEHQDPQIYHSEIERPATQAHFLCASGISFIICGTCFIISCLVPSFVNQCTSLFTPQFMIAIAFVLTGVASIIQGLDKRKVLIEHTYRVFYVLSKTSERTKGQRVFE